MYDMSEWSGTPERGRALSPSKDRLVYLEHLRASHDDEGFRQALTDRMRPADAELERFLFEAEMLANYGVE